MNTPRRLASLLALSCLMLGCERWPGGLFRATPYQRRLAFDSMIATDFPDTTYQRRHADLVRRSRLVPMDSMARLYTAVPRTPDSTLYVIRQAIGCQIMVLMRQHGLTAYQRAYERMTDSLIRSGFKYPDDIERMEIAPGPPLEYNGPNSCGEMRYPRVPDSLDIEPYPALPKQKKK